MLSDELIAKIGADLDVLPLQPTSRREPELLVCVSLGISVPLKNAARPIQRLPDKSARAAIRSSAAPCALR